MTYASDGFLYGLDTVSVSGTDLYKIDPSTGNRTLVTQLPGGVNGLHFGVIPEPATVHYIFDETAVGQIVTIEGIVRLDKDFGAGYRYAVIVEDAKIVQ